MRRHVVSIALVVGSALAAYAAVGNGDIAATPPMTVITVTSPTGDGSGTATLENTTASTSYSVLIGSDATCDPDVTFSVPGGNPITGFAGGTSRTVALDCAPRGSDAMQRCLFHATNNANGAPLADFMAMCLYGDSPPSLTPLQTTVDFGTLSVGDFAEQTLTIRNDGSGAAIRRVYLTTSDIDGDFQLSTPCNPDASACEIDLPADVPPGSTFAIGVKCRPQSPGTHTADVYVGTDTFQLLSLGVTLQCEGAASTLPALALEPTTIEIPAGVEVGGDTATVTVHAANSGGGTLLVRDVRIVDVDTGAADDWTYTASGSCTGQLSMCMLGAGESVDLEITFDPSQIGSRHAALLVSYHDTLDRTFELPLDASGQGATVRRPGPQTPIAFGTVPVDKTATLDLTLINDGNRDTTIDVAVDAPFDVTPATNVVVSPGMPRTLTVECTPQTADTATSTLTVTSPDLAAPLTVDVSCAGSDAELYATPSALALGELRTNAGPRTFTVQLASVNAGMPLTLSGEPVLETSNSSITLGPLSQQTTPASFAVMIAPQSEGSLSATIDVETTSDETLRIPLTANVVKADYIVAQSLDLGTFCVDQPTTSSNLALLSTGGSTITLAQPALAQSPSPFELTTTTPTVYPHVLAAGKTAVVAVTPKRQRTATAVADTLTWTTDVEDLPSAATALSARFIDSGGAIAPPALNFGSVTPHIYTPNGQRVVIQNCNPTPLVLDPPVIRTPFSIDSPSFPTMLSPNESVAFSVGFHPTRVGTVTDTLRITSPQLPGAPLEVVLVGTGAAPELPPDAGVGGDKPGDSGCGCRTGGPGGGWLPLALVVIGLFSVRRRRGSS
jgi:MYXO-CTERM domain-containing protein